MINYVKVELIGVKKIYIKREKMIHSFRLNN